MFKVRIIEIKGLKNNNKKLFLPTQSFWKVIYCVLLYPKAKTFTGSKSQQTIFPSYKICEGLLWSCITPRECTPSFVKGRMFLNKCFHWKIVDGAVMKSLCDAPGDNWEIWDACSSLPNLAYVISEPSCWPFLTSFVKLWHQKDYISKQF